MSRRPVLTFAPDLPAFALAELEACGRLPAWLIDVSGGCILAATAAGAEILGLRPANTPQILDAAMPALGRLRALWHHMPRAEDDTFETLVFWTRDGARRLWCRVKPMPHRAADLASVIADAPAHPTEVQQAARATSPLFLGDDAAKLKEIGRRIREGQMKAPGAERRRTDVTPAPRGHASTASVAEKHAPVADAVSMPVRASLAHELKTPLSAIAAAAEVMKDQRLGPIGSPRYLGYAKDIHGTAQHALSVIDRMLAEFRDSDDANSATLDFAEIDAEALLRSAASELGTLAQRSGIALELDISPRLPHLVADATSLRQIVLNLVTNAFKFTPKGGTVTIAARHEGNGPLTIAITDTGVGMSAEDVTQALGHGRRRRGSRKADGGEPSGLGLGLPLVQKLAAANGGRLELHSTQGQGTRASVVFRKDRVVPI